MIGHESALQCPFSVPYSLVQAKLTGKAVTKLVLAFASILSNFEGGSIQSATFFTCRLYVFH